MKNNFSRLHALPGEDAYYDTYSSVEYEGTIDRFFYDDLTLLQKPWLDTGFVPTVCIYGLAFIVGITGNSIAILAIVRGIKQRTNTTLFLLSLASSDILFLLVCVPYELSRHFISHWHLGTFLCKFSGFIEMMTAVLTVLNLTIVSIERLVSSIKRVLNASCLLQNMG